VLMDTARAAAARGGEAIGVGVGVEAGGREEGVAFLACSGSGESGGGRGVGVGVAEWRPGRQQGLCRLSSL
jgi:hypothetical protein